LEKTVKNRLGVGGSALKPPFAPGSCGWGIRSQTLALLLSPTIITLSSVFLNAFCYPKKEQNNYSKCSVFASSALFHLFFTSNFVVFVDRGRKIIPCPRAQDTLATPLSPPTEIYVLSAEMKDKQKE